MFNLSGSELIFLVLIALVVLGPDKLPEAMRKAGKAYADFKKMTTGFQSEMKSVLDEPMRELRETAELAKKSAMFDFNDAAREKPVSASMATQTPPDAATARRPARATPPDVDGSTSTPNLGVAASSDAENTPATPTVEETLAEIEVKNAPVATGNMWAGHPPADPTPIEATGIDATGVDPGTDTAPQAESRSTIEADRDAPPDDAADAANGNACAPTAGEVPA